MTTDDPFRPSKPETSAVQTFEDGVLADIALSLGLVAREQIDDCLRTQAERRTESGGPTLCEVLLEKGLLDKEDLVLLLREQSRWSEGIPRVPRYEVRSRLGEGATAVVYAAWDRDLKRPVALKVLREVASMSDLARRRFHREAEAAAGIVHPNVVTVHDAGEADGRCYLVMELVGGKPLGDLLAGPGELNDRVRLLEKVARGVAAAHARGIVHRDLKPQNILVTTDGEPKVGDFGLAHLANSSIALTKTGAALGTPLYMSPEQVEGRAKEVSPRTDVWALGAILYQMAAGAPPFPGESQAEIYGKIARLEPLPPADAPRDLQVIVSKALQKNAAARYPDAASFADDLRRFLEGQPIAARPPSALERLRRRIGRHRVAASFLAIIVLLAIATAAAWGPLQARKARGVLDEAARLEREGKLQDARDLYRVAREIDPASDPAGAGLRRTTGELDRQAAAREEALRLVQSAVLETFQGDVQIVAPNLRSVASIGQRLLPGHGVETFGPNTFVVLRYRESVRIELAGEGVLAQRLVDDKTAGLSRGTFEIDIPLEALGRELVFRTDLLEIRGAPARFRVVATKEKTRVEVDEGVVHVNRPSQPAAQVRPGSVLECGPAGAFKSSPLPAPPRMFADGLEPDLGESWEAHSFAPGSRCARAVVSPGRKGRTAVRVEFDSPGPEGIVWVERQFPRPQDWRGATHAAFWIFGNRTGASLRFEVQENTAPTKGRPQAERFNYGFRDDFSGWKQFVVPLSEFTRRTFDGSPNDGFTLKEVNGLCLILAGPVRAPGWILLDEVEILRNPGASPAGDWRPVFDGRSVSFLYSDCVTSWAVENGILVQLKDATQAGRTREDFEDGRIRIRFETRQARNIFFRIRQTAEGSSGVGWDGPALDALEGSPHELVFTCRGSQVSATFDGQPMPVFLEGKARMGALQFNAKKGLRILSIDYRP